MVDTDPAYEPYLGRLHMRVAGRAFEQSIADERLSDGDLRTLYKKDGNIRSKYQGRRRASVDGEKGLTSGIPIFNSEDAADRTGWSVGHTKLRAKTTSSLRELARERGMSAQFAARHVSAENSHALGHGDYGVDHLLSAPSASKAQNTEQLAIELAMREAAGKLNGGLADKNQSLVHAKITDVLHPETGQLMARRYRLIRRQDANDQEGTVVFDHLMDGRRLHISKDEAFGLGKRAHDALMADQGDRVTAENSVYPGSDRARLRLAADISPQKDELKGHQTGVRSGMQAKVSGLGVLARRQMQDRDGLKMAGPALTNVLFPDEVDIGRPAGEADGQNALDEARRRAAMHMARASVLESGIGPGGDAETQAQTEALADFNTSGSVPSDPTTLMMRGMQSMQAKVHAQLGTYEPSSFQMIGYRPEAHMELFEHYNTVINSKGDPDLLEDHEKALLEKVGRIKDFHDAAPRGMIFGGGGSIGGGGRPIYKSRGRKKSRKAKESAYFEDSDDSGGRRMRRKKAAAKPSKRKRGGSDLSDEDDVETPALTRAAKVLKKPVRKGKKKAYPKRLA